jgi:shikimate 5-dehydrogenase
VLGSGGQATAAAQSGLLDNELRFRVGVRANDTAQKLPDFLGDVFTFSSELNSGYFTSVFR